VQRVIVDEKHRILIVDDERVNRKLLSELLEQHHEVILAKNGEQALRRVRADPRIDLILLDVMMPGMDGQFGMSSSTDHPGQAMPCSTKRSHLLGRCARWAAGAAATAPAVG
jgi:DNA-binding NtrC family response regulator